MSLDLAAHPDAIPAEPDAFFLLEVDAFADPSRLAVTPVVAWLGVGPPAFPLRRALDPDGRVLDLAAPEFPEGRRSFVRRGDRLDGMDSGWGELYQALPPAGDGSARRECTLSFPAPDPASTPTLPPMRLGVDHEGRPAWVIDLPPEQPGIGPSTPGGEPASG